MSKIIILEGPDGAGKTSLAREMQAAGFDYLRCGIPEEGQDLLAYYSGMILRALSKDRYTVIDRCFVGEAIYGPVMRQESRLGVGEFTTLIDLCYKYEIGHVFCLPPWETVLGNWASRKHAEYVTGSEKLKQIYDGYRSYSTLFSIGSIFFYDYTRRAPGSPCPFTYRGSPLDLDLSSVKFGGVF